MTRGIPPRENCSRNYLYKNVYIDAPMPILTEETNRLTTLRLASCVLREHGNNARVPADVDDDDEDDDEGRLVQLLPPTIVRARIVGRGEGVKAFFFFFKNVRRKKKKNGDKVTNLAILVTRGRIWKNLGEER